ncbi:MAG: peptidylprolyl isomerase [Planctomycetes bacterium]|nr:peptidylprolyl isomerase [Planctomycetota bacterium]
MITRPQNSWVALCLGLAACQAPQANPRASAQVGPALKPTPIVLEAEMPTVATVGEVEVGVDEFIQECMHEDSALMRQALERLVLAHIVRLETERLGVVLGEELLATSQAAALAQVAEQVEESAPGMGLDEWISTRLGLDPAEFKGRLRERVERELLAQRVVRAWFLSRERADVRILLTEDLESAEAALARHAKGEEFSALARELSVDRSAEDGGRAPAVIRGDTLLGTVAFEAALGEVAGPFEEQGRFLLVRVDARYEGSSGIWSEVREEVELSLEERGVEDAEFWQWKESMEAVHPVDITPLFRLAGEPDL